MSLKTRTFKSALASVLLATTSLNMPSKAIAQVVSANGNTQVYTGPNGVQVVDIAKASQSGLSHNKFDQYNVPANGIVLNNGTRDRITYQSQLAGQVTANMNLDKAAKVILNEVVGANRSTLAGYTEVAGNAASVIVANPYGITCSGCGFINTPNVQMITGRPNVDGSGNLQGFAVTGGDILITGSGLDATAQDYLALVARKVRIEGQVNAKQLDVVAGTNDWNSETLVVTARKPEDAAPDYAVDSSLLGGMYANRIRLIATEAGVGVRVLGEAAANGSDFTINAAGKVELANRISARNDIRIETSSGQGIALDQAGLTAARDIGLATPGELRLNGGSIVAGRDLGLNTASLSDSAVASSATDANRRHAGGALTVNTAGAAAIDGTSFGGSAGLAFDAASLAIGSRGAAFYSDAEGRLAATGALSLGTASVKAAGNLTLTAGGLFSTTAGDRQGILSNAGNIVLAAASIDNSGSLSAEGGNLTLSSVGPLINGGTLQAAGALSIAGIDHAAIDLINTGSILSNGALSLGNGGTLRNQGRLLTAGTLSLDGKSLSNSGTLQALGGANIDVETLDNSGTLIGAAGTGALALSAADVTNSGILQSGGALIASLGDRLVNSGKLVAAGDLSVRAADAARTLQIENGASAYLQSGGLLTIAGTGTARNLAFSALNGFLLADRANLTTNALANNAFVQTEGALTIDTGAFVNTGTILAKSTLSLGAASIDNRASGQIQGSDGAALASAGSVTNAGTLILGHNSGKGGSIAGLSIANSRILQSAGNLALSSRDSIANSGLMLTEGNLAMTASDAVRTLAFTNASNAMVQTGGSLSLWGTGGARNTTFAVSGGSLRAGSIDVRAQSASNAGQVQSLGSATFDLTGAFSNSNAFLAQGLLTLNAASIANTGAGKMQALGSALTASSLDNDGSLLLASDGGRTATLALDTLDNAGALQSVGNLTLGLRNGLTNSGSIVANGNILLDNTGTALSIANQAGGGIRAGGELNITDTGTSFSDQSGVLRGDTLKLSLASLTNNGIIQSDKGGTMTIAGALTNNGGKLVYLGAAGGTASTLSVGSLDNHGTVQTSGKLSLNSGGAITNESGAKILSNGDLVIAGTTALASVTNAGAIQALGMLGISGVNGGGRLASVRGKADSVMMGGTVDIKAGTLSLDDKGSGSGSDGGGLASSGNMTLNLAALDMGGVYSYITAASSGSGLANIAIDQSFINNGLIYSAKDLTISAASITNNRDAGLAASGAMTLGVSGDINNYGSFYTGGLTKLNATYAFRNYEGATVASDGAIETTSDQFINNAAINAKGDITITANEFRNEVTGGDTRRWSYAGSGFNPNNPSDRTTANEYSHGGLTNWSASEHHNDPDDDWGDITWWWTASFEVYQYFAGGTPTQKPTLISDKTLTIRDFQTGANLGGVISGSTVTLSTSKNGATFRNDSLALERQYWQANWDHYEDCDSLVRVSCDYTAYRSYNKSITGRTYDYAVGGGIFAGTLNASGFGLSNSGSAYTATTNSESKSAPGAGSLAGGAGNLDGADFVSGVTGANKASGSSGTSHTPGAGVIGTITGPDGRPAISFFDIVISLPGSPNGLYVISKDPTSRYLVETNPRFTGASGGGLGSDFIAQRLGINPDDLTRRLGNAAYEAYLIQQQIIGQTGAAVLARGESNDQQVQRLMGAAADQAGELGLTYGQPLTDDQVANLKGDIVWMVETEVNGEKVLAPVVYLSASTKAMFDKDSATIAASDANMNLTSLTNTGGTIEGSNALSITSQGDITNTSGTIKGGDVSLTSTGGSIVNQTVAITEGQTGNMATYFGKSAGIESTGSLALDANKNITVSGATVTAGGDASLKAGQDITFTSVQDKTSTSQKIENGSQTTTTITERGSGLTVGGNLAMESGGDTTFKASDANVAGNADIKTGGDFNILAGQNSTETHTETSRSGLGVGGGVWGKETTTTDEFQGRNVASNFNVGGNMNVDSTGAMTVQGSNVNVAGNADVKADSVNILQGNDVDYKTTTTTTETYLRVSSGTSSGTSTYADASASAGGLSAQASAGAGAEAHNSNQGNLELYNKTATTETSDKSTAVGSSFNVGGNANITAKNDVTLQGSELNAGGDVNVDAKNINLLAAQNKDVTTKTTDSTSIGFMVDNNNTASADAGASASVSLTAQAQAEAKAAAESDTTIDLVRNTQSTTTTTDITHTGSSIKSGGSTSLTASDQLKVQGSSVEAAGDVNLTAKDMSFEAVNDVHEVSTTSQTTRAGLYVNGNAEAKAGVEANMVGASAGASAGAEAGVGIQVKHESGSSLDGSTTAQTSSIKAGGNMTRTAENKITDEGTNIEAGGNFTQTAKEWESKAAADTTYGNSSSQSDTARLGIYADAEAGASAGAGLGGSTGADADASVGVKASYEHEDNKANYDSSTAKVSNIKVGGNFSSTTTDKTSLEGTSVDVGGNADLTAGSLDYTAARDTANSSSSTNTGTAEVKVGVSATKAVKAEAGGGYSHEDEQSSSSTAVAGGFSSGGNLNIKTTKGDANFEGTNISAGGNGSIDSAGSVNFSAARDEASSSSNSHSVEVGVSTSTKGSKKSGGIEAGGGFSHSDAQSSTANAGSFTTGGNMTVSAAKDANFEGTALNAGGDANINAGGDVNFRAAESTSSSNSYGAQLKVSAEAETKGKDKPAAGGNDGGADKPGWKSATPTKKDGGDSDNSGWQSATPSKGGDKGGSGGTDGGSKPGGGKTSDGDGPKIGSQRGKTSDTGGTSSGTTDSKSGDNAGPKIGSQREKATDSKPSDGTSQSSSTGSKPADKPAGPKIGSQREKTTDTKTTDSTSQPGSTASKPVDKPAGPKIGSQREKTTDTKTTDSTSQSGSTDPKPADKPAGPKIGSQREKTTDTKTTDSTSQPGSTDPKTSDKPAGPKIGSQREKKPEDQKDGWTSAKPTKDEQKPGWQSAKPGEGKTPSNTVQIGKARAEAPDTDEKKADLQKKGGAGASFEYESESSKTYQGSTVTSGGNVTINAGGNVTRENVKTSAGGEQVTRAGGTVTDSTRQDESSQMSVKGSLKGKSSSADTGTGTADDAGDTGL